MPNSQKITRALTLLFEFQRGRCYLCGGTMNADPVHRELNPNGRHNGQGATVDHILPRSRKGKVLGNIAACHDTCNRAKDNRAPRACEVFYGSVVREAIFKTGIPVRVNSTRPRDMSDGQFRRYVGTFDQRSDFELQLNAALRDAFAKAGRDLPTDP